MARPQPRAARRVPPLPARDENVRRARRFCPAQTLYLFLGYTRVVVAASPIFSRARKNHEL
jgi:hypothetical protein